MATINATNNGNFKLAGKFFECEVADCGCLQWRSNSGMGDYLIKPLGAKQFDPCHDKYVRVIGLVQQLDVDTHSAYPRRRDSTRLGRHREKVSGAGWRNTLSHNTAAQHRIVVDALRARLNAIDSRLKKDLKMARLSAFTTNNLNKQGFGKLDNEAKSRYALPLRFTPVVGATLIVIGLALQSPIWLGFMALVTLSGALLPSGMLIDLIYNLGVRHLFGAPPLPPTPKPRQFSFVLSTIWLAGSALSFYNGLPVLGFILGGTVVAGATILSTTLWCFGSWWYRLIFGHAASS